MKNITAFLVITAIFVLAACTGTEKAAPVGPCSTEWEMSSIMFGYKVEQSGNLFTFPPLEGVMFSQKQILVEWNGLAVQSIISPVLLNEVGEYGNLIAILVELEDGSHLLLDIENETVRPVGSNCQ